MRKILQHPVVRGARTAFRWCRISVLMLLLLLVVAIAYLQLNGLPDFVKRPMLQRLLDKGIRAEFVNMELGWDRGPSILIEMPAFSHPNQPLSPRLTAERAELGLSLEALLHGQIQLRSLDVEGAELKLPVSEATNDALILKRVDVNVQFYTNDVLRVSRCDGNFRGIRVDFLATVNHASELQHWQFPSSRRNNAIDWPTTLRRIAEIVGSIHFSGSPLLQIEAGADGRDMNSAHAEMHFTAAGAFTPWGNGAKINLQAACARLMKPGTEPFFQTEFSAVDLTTPWARGSRLTISSALARAKNGTYEAQIQLDSPWVDRPASLAGSNWFHTENLSCDGRVTLNSSNWIPAHASVNLRGTSVNTRLGSVERFSLQCRAQPASAPPSSTAGWGFWKKVAGWTLLGEAEGRRLDNPKLHLDSFSFTAHWLAPQLLVENFRAALYRGSAALGAALDVNTRELRVSGITDFDVKAIGPLLHPSDRAFLDLLGWSIPPNVNADFRMTLPPWENRPSNWAEDADKSMQLRGDFTVGAASYQGVPVDSARGHFNLAHLVWHVTPLHLTRPDGEADLDYTTSPLARQYRLLIDSHLSPADAMPIIAPRHPHLLDDYSFPKPPTIHAEVIGYWQDPQRDFIRGSLRATNFTARGVPVDTCNVDVKYTNALLTVSNFYFSGSRCQVVAPLTRANFRTKMITISNASGQVDPPVIRRVLAKNPPLFLDYLRFATPPTVSVSGKFSLTNESGNDLHFLVNCGTVHFTNIVADRVSATVDWTGQTISVTNIFATAYHGGTLMGWIVFVNQPRGNSDFAADFSVRDLDLSAVARGVAEKTNHLEGRLDGDIGLSAPILGNKETWNGRGHVHVHDALLWDIKLFGLFSPVLNAIAPGWGHSRAREAMANFSISNGAVSTDDLVIRSSGFRLNFRGTVGLNKHINARAEAVLARDAPVIGPLLSLAFTPLSKLFEYRITGTLKDPVIEPVFIPRFLLQLMHPFKTLKGATTPK